MEIVCTSCGKAYRAEARLGGRRFRCRKCGAVVVIPSPAHAEVVRSRRWPWVVGLAAALLGAGSVGGVHLLEVHQDNQRARLFGDTSQRDDIAAYEGFLERYPLSGADSPPEAVRAKRRLDMLLEWEAARARDTISSYEAYLKSWPAGEEEGRPEPAMAQGRIDILRAWEAAKAADSIESYETFLRLHPYDGRDAPGEPARATRRLDFLRAWKTAQEQDSSASYREFLAKYPAPGGSTSQEWLVAVEKLEMLEAWEAAEGQGMLQSYREFFVRFPDSNRARRARDAIARLSLEAAVAKVSAAGEYAELPRDLETIADRAADPWRAEDLSPLEVQALLDVKVAQICESGSAPFAVAGFRPSDDTAGYVPDGSAGGVVGGTMTDEITSHTVQFTCGYTRKDGRLRGSMARGKGSWWITDLGQKRRGFRGSLTMEGLGDSVLVSTRLPRDELIFELEDQEGGLNINGASLEMNSIYRYSGDGSPRPSKDFVLPVGEGTLYSLRGRVTQLVPGHTFEASPESALCFVLIGKIGLAYVSGAGQVTDSQGKVTKLPPGSP